MAGTKGKEISLDEAGVKTPAHLAIYVDTLGIDLAMSLFLAAGGSLIYLSRKSGDGSLVAQTIGADNASRLAEAIGQNYIKVPIARQWVARVLWSRETSVNETARIVRADIATVRRWLGPAPREQLKQLQLSLFGEETDAAASEDTPAKA